MFIRMRRGLGPASSSMGAALGALDAFVNPGAQRARDELKQANERVVPVPSPSDRLLRENRIVIQVPRAGPPTPDSAPEPHLEGCRQSSRESVCPAPSRV